MNQEEQTTGRNDFGMKNMQIIKLLTATEKKLTIASLIA